MSKNNVNQGTDVRFSSDGKDITPAEMKTAIEITRTETTVPAVPIRGPVFDTNYINNLAMFKNWLLKSMVFLEELP